ncbi:protein O-linked-mannose beta-1,4-N-acetylglucosaminyltransferase 2-like isoform X1 [Iris pallida]|uniref:Protein O-linked-mannose beta-1,4-N-acetylglucosaminyltransferase 2-like isoform X1 n=1 Tax=Iris pallida TaxID=29817 RepID=A0AAX6DMC5_IRIPA|nr:protein O-linked-mannose beta-1,4-N-acetylglucosaminyltransferase 2-like isoform X1 [Iris pallida]
MVNHHHNHHHHHHRKQDSGDLSSLLPIVSAADYCSYRKPTLLRFLVLFAVFSLSFLFVALCLFPSYSFLSDEPPPPLALHNHQGQDLPCSSMRNASLCCDRSARRTDVCFMRGPVRTHSPSNSLLLLISTNSSSPSPQEERIRPYTRKWERSTMSTIDELRLLLTNETTAAAPCDVTHDVPAVVFSTGGYTGNVYHEFNDGIVPLYITSHAFRRKVVFVILEYHDWWISKYEGILSQLSDRPPIDFANDKRTHCFPGAVVGLRIHDELAIDASRMPPNSNTTIRDFRRMLDEAYKPRIQDIVAEERKTGVDSPPQMAAGRPYKLVVVSRNGSRGIENEGALVRLAEGVGFAVEVLRPEKTTELAKIYRALNSSDAMVGVHGAAMTHLLFMRPGAVFVQVVPLGTEWAAESYYGGPAVKLGLEYVRYEILPRESSLYREYPEDDPVLRDPESVNAKGWEVTKRVYLDGQNVSLDLERFRKRLVRAHEYLVSKRWNSRKIF